MENYDRIRLSSRALSNDRLTSVCRTTLKLILPLLADFQEDERLTYGITKLDKDLNQFESVEKKALKASAPSLTDLDKQQDYDFTDFKAYLKLQLRHRQPARRQAAETLYFYLISLGDITRRPHGELATAMAPVFKTLDSKEYRSMLNATQALEYYNNLKDSHAKFEAAYLEKIKTANQKVPGSRAELRKTIENDYNNLYAYLLSLEYFGKDTYHRPFLAAFNDVRKSYIDNNKKKAAHAKKD